MDFTLFYAWLSGRALDAIVTASQRGQLKQELEQWVREVDRQGLSVTSQSMESIWYPDCEQPLANKLADKLSEGDLISEQDMLAVLLERWRLIAGNADEPTSFFKQPESLIKPLLESLAQRLRAVLYAADERVRLRDQLKTSDRIREISEGLTGEKIAEHMEKLGDQISQNLRREAESTSDGSMRLVEAGIEKAFHFARNYDAIGVTLSELIVDVEVEFGDAGNRTQQLIAQFRLVEAAQEINLNVASGSLGYANIEVARIHARLSAEIFDFGEAIAVIQKIPESERPSDLLLALGKYYCYAELFSPCIDCLSALLEKHPLKREELAEALVVLGRAYRFITDYSRAEKCFGSVIELSRRLAEPSQRIVEHDIDARIELANIVRSKGQNYEDAIVLAENVLRMLDETDKKSTEDISEAYSVLGFSHSGNGDRELARIFLEKALRVAEYGLPKNHPMIATRLNDLGTMTSDPLRARSFYLAALEIDEATFGHRSTRVALRKQNLAMAEASLAKYDEALKLLYGALRVQCRFYPDHHPEIGDLMRQIGEVYQLSEREVEAEKCFKRALESCVHTYDDGHPAIGVAYARLGLCQLNVSKDNAEINLNKGFEILRERLGAEHPDTVKIKCVLETVFRAS